MRVGLFIIAIFLCAEINADDDSASPEDNGRLCLASVPAPNDSPKSLSNPSGENPDVAYAVKVGDFDRVDLSRVSGTWITELRLDKKHPIVIYADGQRIASFYLKFEVQESSQCLFLNSLYLTWQLWPSSRTGSWCDCDSPDTD